MAETPKPKLHFPGPGNARAYREVEGLPRPLPAIGDDFDWQQRDYRSFRQFMLEELAARFPQRRRWTSSDIEVVLVEALAAVLDQISDKADRVAAEQVLESARRPESVRRLLSFIGHDAVREAELLPPGPTSLQARRLAMLALERDWIEHPERMDAARRAGPRSVHRQQRMVCVDDYARLLERHPLVLRARARAQWTGSWTRIRVAVVAQREAELDLLLRTQGDPEGTDALFVSPRLRAEIERFHRRLGARQPPLDGGETSIRMLLEHYIDSQRMIGHEIVLCEPDYVALELGFAVRVGARYFRSEVSLALRQALSTEFGGFFEHGRHDFGQRVYVSDLVELIMSLDGVENVVVSPFKRAGARHPDQAQSGELSMSALEIAVCDNDPARPELGRYQLTISGGRTG